MLGLICICPAQGFSRDGVVAFHSEAALQSHSKQDNLKLQPHVTAGGRALVTVWAYEQEEQKLLAKWQRIEQSPDGAAASRGGAGNGDSTPGSGSPSSRIAAGNAASTGAFATTSSSTEGNSLDYMVPWHLPFHRVEAAAIAAHTTGGAHQPASGSGGAQAANGAAPGTSDDADGPAAPVNGSCAGAQGAAQSGVPVGRIDPVKNTIVFDRYYHLFRRGELEALAAGVPGAEVAEAFYDKSNWCIVLEKAGSGGSGSGGSGAASRPEAADSHSM